MKRRILVAEDEPSLQMVLLDRLASENYDVTVVGNGIDAEQRTVEQDFDLLLLDIAMPQKNGFDVCRDLRATGFKAPILMLTAKSQTFDKVLGLKIGADDYLTKPFEMEELVARVEALLRRGQAPSNSQTSKGKRRFGEIEIDRLGAEVTRDGHPIDLSALEFKLLEHLIEHQGEVQSRDQLLDQVWGYESDVFTRTVDVHIASLRQKLESNPKRPRHILTVHGRGYKFAG